MVKSHPATEEGSSFIGAIVGVAMSMVLVIVLSGSTVGFARWLHLNALATQTATEGALSLGEGSSRVTAMEPTIFNSLHPGKARLTSFGVTLHSVSVTLTEPTSIFGIAIPLSSEARAVGP